MIKVLEKDWKEHNEGYRWQTHSQHLPYMGAGIKAIILKSVRRQCYPLFLFQKAPVCTIRQEKKIKNYPYLQMIYHIKETKVPPEFFLTKWQDIESTYKNQSFVYTPPTNTLWKHRNTPIHNSLKRKISKK